MALTVCLAGCLEIDLPMLTPNNTGGNSSGYHGVEYDSYAASFWVDSLVTDSDTTAIIHAHIQYDSIMVITGQKVSIASTSLPRDLTFSAVKADTIDFRFLAESTIHSTGRKEWIYNYELQIDTNDLQKDHEYALQILTECIQDVVYWSYCDYSLLFTW